jgi:hypothetical protein
MEAARLRHHFSQPKHNDPKIQVESVSDSADIGAYALLSFLQFCITF